MTPRAAYSAVCRPEKRLSNQGTRQLLIRVSGRRGGVLPCWSILQIASRLCPCIHSSKKPSVVRVFPHVGLPIGERGIQRLAKPQSREREGQRARRRGRASASRADRHLVSCTSGPSAWSWHTQKPDVETSVVKHVKPSSIVKSRNRWSRPEGSLISISGGERNGCGSASRDVKPPGFVLRRPARRWLGRGYASRGFFGMVFDSRWGQAAPARDGGYLRRDRWSTESGTGTLIFAVRVLPRIAVGSSFSVCVKSTSNDQHDSGVKRPWTWDCSNEQADILADSNRQRRKISFPVQCVYKIG